MQRWIGRWLVGVGALHSLLGLVVFAAPLRELIGAGWFNALGSRDPMRNLAFWFLFGGVFTCLVGYLVDWIERLPGTVIPRPAGWTLLITAAVGATLAPASGFWLVFPAAIGALVQPRRATRRAPPIQRGAAADERAGAAGTAPLGIATEHQVDPPRMDSQLS